MEKIVCEILEEDTISSFLKSNNYSLYINSLNFDPNKDSNIDEKGKAYLKWCVPGVGREKNIDIIKDIKIKYDYNVTKNKNYFTPIKIKYDKYYFKVLPGYILILFNLVISTLCHCCTKINENSSEDTCKCAAECYQNATFQCFLMVISCISWIFLVIGLILSIKPLYLLFSGLGTQFINHLIIILIILYLAYIFLIIFLIIFLCYFLFYIMNYNIMI